eukprot:9631117-Prorocentrum_lima.AAC.1
MAGGPARGGPTPPMLLPPPSSRHPRATQSCLSYFRAVTCPCSRSVDRGFIHREWWGSRRQASRGR